MIAKLSAGLLLYRKNQSKTEVFLVHPGGPYWKSKDEGVWSIPKGEFNEDEDPLDAAKREFFEETGTIISGEFFELQSVKLKSGKKVFAWIIEKNIEAENIVSNNFEMEWPPRSGKFQSFPEVDKGEWMTIEKAKKKINMGQKSFLEQLQQILERET